MTNRLGAERGFALPLTILIIALLTVMLTSGFARVRADRQISNAGEEASTALAIAQSGLQTYMATVNTDGCLRTLRPADGDSVRINVTGGYADVVARVAIQPVDTGANWTYLIRSTGHYINPAAGPESRSRRVVAQFAQWQSGRLRLEAPWTAVNGVNKEAGGTGEFRGNDLNSSSCDEPDVYALRVPGGQGPSNMTGFFTNGRTPNVYEDGFVVDVADSTGIDWNAILNGAIIPDYTSVQIWDMTYPIQMVTGDATIGSDGSSEVGTGLLIVTGDLRIRGVFLQWYGVILVGGELKLDADDQRFDGYVVSGLNEQIGVSVGLSDFGEPGYTDFDFNSLYVRLALQSLAGFVPLGNTWIDNWASY